MDGRDITAPIVIWGVLWRSNNHLDGNTYHIMRRGFAPVMFKTRQEARNFISEHYGYIATRDDLKSEPHGWRMPIPVRLHVEAQT